MINASGPLGPHLRARPLLALFVVPAVLLALPTGSALAQACGIGVSAQPPTVNYPAPSLPASGVSFAETLNVNYSSAYSNQTLTLEYLNGSRWAPLQSFTGNAVGFTEVDHGLTADWAKLGENDVRVVGGGCVSGATVFRVQTDATASISDVGIYVSVILLSAAFLLLGRRLGWRWFAVVAAGVYLVLSPFTGQRYDIYFLLSSGIRMLQHVNPFSPGSPPIYPGPLKWAYPPLYAAYSAVAFAAYQLITGSPLPSVSALTYPGWLTSTYSVFQAFVPANLPVLVFILKLPMVASALATGVLITRMTGDRSAAVWWAANPLVVLVAAVWGQIDPISTLLAVGSVYCFRKERLYHSYLLASLGAAVKVWPVLLIPIILTVTLRTKGRAAIKPLVAVLPALLITVGLYAIYGNPIQSLFLLVYARGVPTFAGALSVNGLTWQELLYVLNSPPVPLFLLAGIPAYCVMLAWAYLKRDGDIVKWLVASILVFYLTYNYVNPQYFSWIVPFLMIQRRRLATTVFSILPLAYMALAYNIFYFVSAGILPNEFSTGASIADQLKVNAFYQSPVYFVLLAGTVPTIAYAYLLYREFRAGGGSGARAGASERPVNSPQDEQSLVANSVQREVSRQSCV